MEKLNTLGAQNELNASTSKVRDLINSIVDDSTFVEVGAFSFTANETFENKKFDGEGVVTGYALINSIPCYLYAQNSEVLKGGFGKAQADKIVNIIDMAIKTGTPILSIMDSQGARIGEGVTVLEGYSKVMKKVTEASGMVPQIAVVNGNVFGQNAMISALADVTMMVEGSLLSSSSAMLVSANSNSNAPFDKLVGNAVHEEKSGIASMTVAKADLKDSISKVFDLILCGGELGEVEASADAVTSAISAEATVDNIVDAGTKVVLKGKYVSNVQTVLARMGGATVGVLAVDGEISGAGARKAGAFVRFLDSFNIPLVSVVNSEGIKATKEDEACGLTRDLASLSYVMAETSNVKISVVLTACGVAYSTLASKCIGFDYSLAVSDAVISTVPASVGADLFFEQAIIEGGNDATARANAVKRYEEEKAGAIYSAQSGYVDNIVERSYLRPYVISALSMLRYKGEGPKFTGNYPL